MKRIVLVYGLIAGAIVSVLMLASQPLLQRGVINFDNGMVIGYTSMVIALALIFFAVKTYRDQHQNGSLTFGQGAKIGLLITLIASLMYAISWEVYYTTSASDFTEQYTTYYIEKMKKGGASESKIGKAREEMASFNEMYRNPIVRFGVTIVEILPVGIVISLVSAGILRKRRVSPV